MLQVIGASREPAVMAERFFFHLIDSENVIRDERGALAIDLADARRAAAEIIEEFKLEQADSYQTWRSWRLVVTDDAAQFALVLPLGDDGRAGD